MIELKLVFPNLSFWTLEIVEWTNEIEADPCTSKNLY